MLLPLLNLATIAYLAFAIASSIRELRADESRSPNVLQIVMRFVLAGAVPLAVAITMSYLFLILEGATTVQLNVGSPSRLNVWSTWVDLFLFFLILTAASALGTLVWLIRCAREQAMRLSLPAAFLSLLLAVLALFTVVSYLPSA